MVLGRQQNVWGKADGLKVLDLVNPQDFRELILDDFDDSRIPLWAVNAEIPVAEVVVPLVWIPEDCEAHKPHCEKPKEVLGVAKFSKAGRSTQDLLGILESIRFNGTDMPSKRKK